MNSGMVVSNICEDVEGGALDGYDFEAEVRALDEVIAILQARVLRVEKLEAKWAQRRTFWDELIDVNCTPHGQDSADDSTPWDWLFEAWWLVGTQLSNAMGSFRCSNTWQSRT